MTCSRVMGTLEVAHQEAQRLRGALERGGFAVSRIKLEAAPWNPEVPHRDADALERGGYFEQHFKLCLPSEALSVLAQVCARHGTHLSHNPLKRLDEGQEERFVTLRLRGVGLERAQVRIAGVRSALQALGFSLLSDVLEFCVYDSDCALDGSWGQEGVS